MRTVLVTDAAQYAGPGAVEVLLRQDVRVVCHDASFRARAARDAFQGQYPRAECMEGVDPASLVAEMRDRGIDEVASFGIQVNVVAPNYLYSETYYPRARFVDDPQGREHIASIVPMGRLGTPEEVGELIAFLASGRAGFVTGQVIYFTGGWP